MLLTFYILIFWKVDVNLCNFNLNNDDICSILTAEYVVATFTVDINLHENHRWAVNYLKL
jgi:hypothetical protein